MSTKPDQARPRLQLQYPPELPVSGAREQIVDALRRHQVLIVCGDTGSGKTTQLPKMCLEAGLGERGRIGHTQPRRIAARAVAARLAEETGTQLGDLVGYKVRFNDQTRAETRIKVMTDGILLAEIQHDPQLNAYDALIVDEAHERSLNIDFLLGYLRRLLPRRPDLKVIVTSATIDPQRFARHFNDAPVIEVAGRTYPVQVEYRPAPEDDADLSEQVVAAVQQLARRELADLGGGQFRDMLVFLPGERYIRDAELALKRLNLPGFEILPLYARLPTGEQDRIFQPGRASRVVLATNVAETSLTVPRIRFVIDSGLARVSRYSPRSKIQRLAVEKISQAAADQRKGRCGRLAPGLCVRLYAEEDFAQRPAYTDSEILRTNLASVILQMEALRLGQLSEFPFLEKPPLAAVRHGYQLLFELGAVDAHERITRIGRQLSQLPADPRIGRMLLAGAAMGSLDELFVIAAALSVQDPRERPPDRQEAADERHAQFTDARSDFLFYLNLWEALRRVEADGGNSALRRWCRQNFISWRRMREWQDIHAQLRESFRRLRIQVRRAPAAQAGRAENGGERADAEPSIADTIPGAASSDNAQQTPRNSAEYAAIHRALLTGLLSLVAQREEKREYRGVHGNLLTLFPGSALTARPPGWLMAAELLETSRVFATTGAGIKPAWVEQAAPHLVRYTRDAAFFDAASGRVLCLERVNLWNLVLAAERRVPLAPHDARGAREIFIAEGLVAERLKQAPKAVQANWRRRRQVDAIEAKIRRRDVALGDAALVRLYDERLPESVVDARTLTRWLDETPQAEAAFALPLDAFMVRDVPEVTAERFPDRWQHGDNPLALQYCFAPGDPEDGITLDVPQALLPGLTSAGLSWLVPGWRHERIAALLRTLPKAERRKLVPVPDTALRLAGSTPEIPPANQSLEEWLAERLRQEFGIRADPLDWERALPDELRMRVRVLAMDGRVLADGRDLRALQGKHSARPAAVGFGVDEWERRGLKSWDFDVLPESVEVRRGKLTLTLYPALVDRESSVDLQLADSPASAQAASRGGILRLAALSLNAARKDLERRLSAERDLVLQYRGVGHSAALVQDFVAAVLGDTILPPDAPLPRTRAQFDAAVAEGRRRIGTRAQELLQLTREVLSLHDDVRRRLRNMGSAVPAHAREDLEEQLAFLVHERMLRDTPPQWRAQLPRYLKAIVQRLEKLAHGHPRDAEYTRMLRTHQERLDSWRQRHPDEPMPSTVAEYAWLLQELRVSLFAQQLGTVQKVSDRRLEEYWQNARLAQPAARVRSG